MAIKHISYSYLHTFTCPYAAFLRYEAALKGPVTEYLALGNALHLALELSHRDKQPFNLTAAIKLFVDEFNRIIWDDEVLVQYPKQKKLESDGMAMLELYAKKLGIDYSEYPTEVEQEFRIPFNTTLDIVGKIDRVDITEDGRLIVTDYKSGAKEPDLWFLRKNLQFTAYAAAARILYGRLPDEMRWHHLRTGRIFSTERTQEDIDDLMTHISNAVKMNEMGMRHRVFHEQVCGWCNFKGAVCDDRELEKSIVSKMATPLPAEVFEEDA